MQRETSNDTFLDYGSVYHQPIDREHPELIHQTMVAITSIRPPSPAAMYHSSIVLTVIHI